MKGNVRENKHEGSFKKRRREMDWELLDGIKKGVLFI